MLEYDFEDSIGCWIAMTSHALRRSLNEKLANENITFRQWEVLAWLSYSQELSQVELAERLGIEAPALAGILSRMERDGWLERRACSDDRRKKRIRATEQAEAIWNRTATLCKQIRIQAIQGISEDDLQSLNRICKTIRENLGQPMPAEEAIAEEEKSQQQNELMQTTSCAENDSE